MKATPYLFFNGQCKEAFEFYAQGMGGTIEVMMDYRDSPMENDVPEEWRDHIMHATLRLQDDILMASDMPPNQTAQPQGFAVSLSPSSAAEGERIFNALAEGGTVTMPFEQTFWATGFGMVTDRFGIPWMVNCE